MLLHQRKVSEPATATSIFYVFAFPVFVATSAALIYSLSQPKPMPKETDLEIATRVRAECLAHTSPSTAACPPIRF